MINENSYVSIGIIFSLIAIAGGFVVWLTKIHSLARDAYHMSKENHKSLEAVVVDRNGVVDRLARIETKLDIYMGSLTKS